MKSRLLFVFILFVFTFSCDEKETGIFPSLYLCDSQLGCGNGSDVPYCTWGFKFGDNNPFSPNGPNVAGPKSRAASISFKFQEVGIVFKTPKQNFAESVPFTEEEKTLIRTSILEWSSVADINFIEKKGNEAGNITIANVFIPDNSIGAYANPQFIDAACNQTAGLLIMHSKYKPTSRIVIHEMGHVLGLGHVASRNAMNPNGNYEHLQPGDIAGIQSIYGSK
jgi:hypothetical protein